MLFFAPLDTFQAWPFADAINAMLRHGPALRAPERRRYRVARKVLRHKVCPILFRFSAAVEGKDLHSDHYPFPQVMNRVTR
jgi:hypothetical protein